MDAVKEFFDSPEHARNYEEKVKRSNKCGPEMLFEMVKPYIRSNEKILDLGIGTGKTSELFHEAGLRIYGMDFSVQMLKICAKKKITRDLKLHDLKQFPYPYKSNSMDHVVCGGVLPIFKDLRPIFREVARILWKGGVFAFTCSNHNRQHCRTRKYINRKYTAEDIILYEHNKETVIDLLEKYGFVLQKSSEFLDTLVGQDKSLRIINAYLAVLI